ncbi:hypothetical protein MMC08_005071 [Hypocenomyce scalaris]|nr:hypothetical protein [Hypocenomyce scalaris]
MAVTRSQTASRAGPMKTTRVARAAGAQRQKTGSKATNHRLGRLPRISLRVGPRPNAAQEALAIARHNRQDSRPHINLRLAPLPPPPAAQQFGAIARPGGRPYIPHRMDIRPTPAEEAEAIARHGRQEGRSHINLRMAPPKNANGKGRPRLRGGHYTLFRKAPARFLEA